MDTRESNIAQIIKDIECHGVFDETIEVETHTILKFNAMRQAGRVIARYIDKHYGLEVLKWQISDEYFVIIKK